MFFFLYCDLEVYGTFKIDFFKIYILIEQGFIQAQNDLSWTGIKI